MNWRAIRAIIRKDLSVVTRSKAIMLPLIILPLVLQVLMPGGFALLSRFAPLDSEELDDFDQILEAMPASLVEEFEGLDQRQVFLVLSVVYLFAPMYLIIPMMVSSVIAADSFAGEKERKTLEALLHAPTTNFEMLFAKILSAFIPAVVISIGAFVLYGIVANGIGWPLMHRIFFPNAMWLVLVLWVAPAASAVGLGATVLVSTSVRTFQEAQQMAGLIVLPVVALMLGQVSGLIYFSIWLVLGLGLVLWVVAGIVLAIAADLFERERLLTRL